MKAPPKAAPAQQGKPPPPAPSPEAIEKAERADVRNILSKDPQAATDSKVEQEADDDPDPPLVLVQGTLSFPFDREEILKAVMAAAKPLSASDKKLKETLDLAAEVLKGDYDASEAFDGLTARVREAWARANRAHPAGHLDARAEQALVEQRRYQRRTLLDGEWIRAILTSGAGEHAVVYLPVALEKRLPLFPRFAVKMLCKLHPPQDADEPSHVALEASAIARATPRPKLARP